MQWICFVSHYMHGLDGTFAWYGLYHNLCTAVCCENFCCQGIQILQERYTRIDTFYQQELKKNFLKETLLLLGKLMLFCIDRHNKKCVILLSTEGLSTEKLLLKIFISYQPDSDSHKLVQCWEILGECWEIMEILGNMENVGINITQRKFYDYF